MHRLSKVYHPPLEDLVEIKFVKDCRKMLVKMDFREEGREVDFPKNEISEIWCLNKFSTPMERYLIKGKRRNTACIERCN